jgi:hypothetical protein
MASHRVPPRPTASQIGVSQRVPTRGVYASRPRGIYLYICECPQNRCTFRHKYFFLSRVAHIFLVWDFGGWTLGFWRGGPGLKKWAPGLFWVWRAILKNFGQNVVQFWHPPGGGKKGGILTFFYNSTWFYLIFFDENRWLNGAFCTVFWHFWPFFDPRTKDFLQDFNLGVFGCLEAKDLAGLTFWKIFYARFWSHTFSSTKYFSRGEKFFVLVEIFFLGEKNIFFSVWLKIFFERHTFFLSHTFFSSAV